MLSRKFISFCRRNVSPLPSPYPYYIAESFDNIDEKIFVRDKNKTMQMRSRKMPVYYDNFYGNSEICSKQ